ncbi:hypothetical protein DFO66_11094 [Brevibacterium sanguinis]|uniref:Amidohydrolase 3 domain-containing protein n=2 Tax=Brevibacterium TaxID=1696 RepID=A0A366IF16_9MICO|nr:MULTISPECIES: amidohydrolase [Brevibacterium]RBP63469.1 hypothetical protein DFO66_11094 [Brevibacterium sanguinis]RBP69936.1 hypothetical protein DFO65_11094 [Brevibacterium celere]
MAITLFHNGQVFLGEQEGEADRSRPDRSRPGHARPDREPAFAEALVVDAGTILFVGTATEASTAAEERAAETGTAVTEVDLEGRLVLPGFVDGHAHILGTGEALARVPLTDAGDLDEIRSRLVAAREADPQAPRILGRGWLFDAVPGNAPTAAMIDEVIPDIPVYLDANDYHSCWVNSAALAEMGIDRETPDPVGGEIERDANGDATGMLYETAAGEFAWNHLDEVSDEASEDDALERVFTAYLEAGVTTAVDMGLGEVDLAAFARARERHGGELPMNVIAHWRVNNTGDRSRNLAQVDRAIDLARAGMPSGLRVAGIKCIIDGTIDACTATMSEPFTNGRNADPIWPLADLEPVVVAADAADLQIALHAIGDEAIDIAIRALESAVRVNGEKPRRHRIEHLEYAAPGTAERLAALGITASMQPVHTDAAIRDNWTELVGPERARRGFAWPEYEDAGALLAFSTDTPTAPHEALPNLYIATTRKSALDPSLAANEPELAVGLTAAILHATRDAAIASGEGERRGALRPGFAADLTVLDADPFVLGLDSLREGTVRMTMVAGQVVHRH